MLYIVRVTQIEAGIETGGFKIPTLSLPLALDRVNTLMLWYLEDHIEHDYHMLLEIEEIYSRVTIARIEI